MTKIYRHKLVLEEIDLPEGKVPCTRCKGKGSMSKYDEGLKTFVYSRLADAQMQCYRCNGTGMEDGD